MKNKLEILRDEMLSLLNVEISEDKKKEFDSLLINFVNEADPRNQYVDVTPNISEVKAETKKKSATITFFVPNKFATEVMRCLSVPNLDTISNIQLSWLDTREED